MMISYAKGLVEEPIVTYLPGLVNGKKYRNGLIEKPVVKY